MEYTGFVKWFNSPRGIGFIVCEHFENDILLHYSQIQMDGFKKVRNGDRVTFEIDDTREQGLSAKNVVVVK